MLRTARSGAVAVAFLAAALSPVPAAAEDIPPVFSPEAIVFPVIGEVVYTDTFGAPRSGGRTHEGTDIMSADGSKGYPVVAAAAGVVDWVDEECCHLGIDHGDGWRSVYIHLDNDTAGTDDGLGWGIADGIVEGTAVEAGQLIGWLGDSGNAEDSVPHLHFELRQDDVAVNSYPYLLTATVIQEGADGGKPADGWFVDDNDSEHEANIDTMFELGVTRGCNPPTNDRYCPSDWLTRGQTAAFLRRHLDLPAVTDDYFADDAASEFQDDINALAAIGVAFGCTETDFCPDAPLTRAEMAEMLVRAYDYAPVDVDYFTDDDGNAYEEAINALKGAGVTKGCNPPGDSEYCPDSPLTRAEMATFFARAVGMAT